MNFYPILKKELHSYFFSTTLYIILAIFLVLSGYFFFTDLSFYNWINVKGTANPVEGLWQYYFNDLRFVLMLLIPFITMRLLAEEKRLGTYELITSYPVSNGDIVAGKYLASLLVFVLMMAMTFVNVLFWSVLWGFTGLEPLIAGYLGLFFLGCSLISCGLFISSLTSNQLVAGMATLGIFIFFWFLTWNEMMASEEAISVLVRFSLFDRIESFFKGVIDTKDVVFFVLFTLFFLYMTLCSVASRFWRGGK